jgi:hypothetical protein
MVNSFKQSQTLLYVRTCIQTSRRTNTRSAQGTCISYNIFNVLVTIVLARSASLFVFRAPSASERCTTRKRVKTREPLNKIITYGKGFLVVISEYIINVSLSTGIIEVFRPSGVNKLNSAFRKWRRIFFCFASAAQARLVQQYFPFSSQYSSRLYLCAFVPSSCRCYRVNFCCIFILRVLAYSAVYTYLNFCRTIFN